MKYISEDKKVFDSMEACMAYEATINLKKCCKLYEDSFDEITDYEELGFSTLTYIKIINAEKFVKELAKLEDTIDDTGLYLDDLFDLEGSLCDLVDKHIYAQNYNGDWFDITLAIDTVGR